MTKYELLAKSLRRDAIDYRDGLFAVGTDKTMDNAADCIEQLQAELQASQRRERAAVEAIRKSLREEGCQRHHLNRCSQCARFITDNRQRKYKFGCESLCPDALKVMVDCGFKNYEPLIHFAEEWSGPREAGEEQK